MTWSIIARDEQGRFGIAIASRFFAVGALCVHARGGVGALCTQALMNPTYGPRGLAMLAEGRSAAQVVAALTGSDAGRSQRQLHLLPARGAGAAHTGGDCIGWCGHWQREDFSVAGNMLAGESVIVATAAAYVAHSDLPLAERLIMAMRAGEAEGGDKRGRQSAALRIQGAEDYPELDLRADDHPDPLGELQRLYAVSLERFQPFIACLPRRAQPAGELDRERIEQHITEFHAAHRKAPKT
ncbi:DUF1028 domain-containing protein [Aquabacterium sp.]|uniref:DUF1028 domain-containing protein n=1 Tax=Aquabacterium sp. TaxID=1872578 RepID=UPI0037846885